MTKKYLIPFLLLFLYACQKDDGPDPIPAGPDEVILAGRSAPGGGTRTSLGDTGLDNIPVYWSAGDGLGALASTPGTTANNARATLMEGAGTQNGVFSASGIKMAERDNVLLLYYPYSRDALSPGEPDEASPVRVYGGSEPYLKGFVPSAQVQQSPGVFDQFGRYGFSVAVSDPADRGEQVTFTMKHMLAYLELSLHNSADALAAYRIDKLEVEATGGSNITGAFKSSFEGAYEAVDDNGGARKITLTVANPQALGNGTAGAQEFLAAMLPADLTGEEITVTVSMRETGGAQAGIRKYAKTFNGADFTSGDLQRIEGDVSKWTFTESYTAGMATFIEMVSELEAAAAAFYDSYTGSKPSNTSTTYYKKVPAWTAAAYIRQFSGSYISDSWGLAGGSLTSHPYFADFKAHVQANLKTVYDYFNTTTAIPGLPTEPVYGDFTTTTIDLRHMGATMSALLYSSVFDANVNDISGWAGDLQQLMGYVLKRGKDPSGGTGDKDHYIALAKEYAARPGTYFDMDDLMGDVDAVNIAVGLVRGQNMTLAEAIRFYYTNADGYMKRFSSFAADLGATESAMYTRVRKFTVYNTNIFESAYMNVGFKEFGLTTITAAQSDGFAQGFVEFINELKAKE